MRALVIFVMIVLGLPAYAEQRFALVVGNSAYADWPKLTNPANDADLLAKKLGSVGFRVTEVKDAPLTVLNQTMAGFNEQIGKAARSGEHVTALFFFAGHGVGYNNQSYLVPVDAPTGISDEEIPFRTIPADTLYEQIGRSGAQTVLIFLDACRSPGPGLNKIKRGGAGAGLPAPAITANGSGYFIAYSTAPGKVAADGTGKNSPFATALANNISRPGVSLLDMMSDVRLEVVSATNSDQRPWESASLLAPFYMVPGSFTASDAADEKTRRLKQEEAYYNRIKASKRIADFDGFLETWPDGSYSGIVSELKRKAIEEQTPRPLPPAATSFSGVPGAPSASGVFAFQREELGVRVASVRPGTPFAPYVFRNDLIRQVDGGSAIDIADLETAPMDRLNRNGQVILQIQRGRTAQMVTVKLR